ncbi:MAG: hypothetical protein QW478_06075 [Candidatus Micrarchaeaceae archaeon]
MKQTKMREIKEAEYLKPDEVAEVMKFMPRIPIWHKGIDFGLKYKYIKLQGLIADWERKGVDVVIMLSPSAYLVKTAKGFDIKIISDKDSVYLIQTAKGYAISFLHGYTNHFELPETIKYSGLWWDKPKLWDKICKEASL